eukprot:8850887-Ditylum_brightwellii.AAC.2
MANVEPESHSSKLNNKSQGEKTTDISHVQIKVKFQTDPILTDMVVVVQYWSGGWIDTLINRGCQSLWVVENVIWTGEELEWMKASYMDVTAKVIWVTQGEIDIWTKDFICLSMWWMDGEWKLIESWSKWHIQKCHDTKSFANLIFVTPRSPFMHKRIDKSAMLLKYFNVPYHIIYEAVGGGHCQPVDS